LTAQTGQLPPQSISVSSPFLLLSSHVAGETHVPAVQTPLAQSPTEPQLSPSWHAGHAPPHVLPWTCVCVAQGSAVTFVMLNVGASQAAAKNPNAMARRRNIQHPTVLVHALVSQIAYLVTV
jgi:hypothetical protein